MVAEVLLEGLVAHDHAEAAARIDVDGSLGVQIVESDHLLDSSRAALIERGEMYLVVDEPVVVHAVGRAVLQVELHKRVAIEAVDVDGARVRERRSEVVFRSGCGNERIVAGGIPAPDGTTVQPPGRAEGFPRPEKRRAVKEKGAKE